MSENYFKCEIVKHIHDKGAIILDFNGVILNKGVVNERLLLTIIHLLNNGFRIAINTNNNVRELSTGNFSKLYYKGHYFLDTVIPENLKNFKIYADNRTSCYFYKEGKMIKDEIYSIGKGFESNKIKSEIFSIVSNKFKKYKVDKELIDLHPNLSFPHFQIIEGDFQIRVEMYFPSNYSFGSLLVKKIYEDLKEYKVEVHIGRTGLYISRAGLKKSLAVNDFLDKFNLDPFYTYYIGDKFTEKYDSDLWCIRECNINGINVGSDIIEHNNIQTLTKEEISSLEILNEILNVYLFNKTYGDVLDFEEFVERLSKAYHDKNQCICVGLNGPTGAGKTFFTNKVKEYLIEKKIDVQVVYLDDFMYPRANRNQLIGTLNRENIKEYYLNAWDIFHFEKILSLLLQKKDGIYKYDKSYNRKTGLCNIEKEYFSCPSGVLLVEGTECINEQTLNLFDIKVLITANEEEAFRRINLRNNNNVINNEITSDFICYRYSMIDHYHRFYLLNMNSINYNFKIDNSFYDLPCILERNN